MNARTRAALWVPGAPVRDLGTLGGDETSALGINQAGVVVGPHHPSANRMPFWLLWSSHSTSTTGTGTRSFHAGSHGDVAGACR